MEMVSFLISLKYFVYLMASLSHFCLLCDLQWEYHEDSSKEATSAAVVSLTNLDSP